MKNKMVWIKTPEQVEIGKRKSRCRKCGKLIINKEPRVMRLGEIKGGKGNHIYRYYYCCNCGKKEILWFIGELKNEITHQRKLLKEIKKLKEKHKDILILSNLENENGKK